MAVTIFETLMNVDYNIQYGRGFGFILAKDQLHNAVILLEKGYSLHDEVEPLLEKFGSLNSVPEKGK